MIHSHYSSFYESWQLFAIIFHRSWNRKSFKPQSMQIPTAGNNNQTAISFILFTHFAYHNNFDNLWKRRQISVFLSNLLELFGIYFLLAHTYVFAKNFIFPISLPKKHLKYDQIFLIENPHCLTSIYNIDRLDKKLSKYFIKGVLLFVAFSVINGWNFYTYNCFNSLAIFVLSISSLDVSSAFVRITLFCLCNNPPSCVTARHHPRP